MLPVKPAEFLDALKALGLSQSRFAAILGVSPRTVNRWAKGHVDVPQYVVAYLELARRRPDPAGEEAQ